MGDPVRREGRGGGWGVLEAAPIAPDGAGFGEVDGPKVRHGLRGLVSGFGCRLGGWSGRMRGGWLRGFGEFLGRVV